MFHNSPSYGTRQAPRPSHPAPTRAVLLAPVTAFGCIWTSLRPVTYVHPRSLARRRTDWRGSTPCRRYLLWIVVAEVSLMGRNLP
ncbi:hypothetical protein FMEAI12_4110025 [Parafrankia sp. Ea1.12]|nr:hypothetical protein FMEAI12_4110025 [Parafrankia sp. Ea1.12]